MQGSETRRVTLAHRSMLDDFRLSRLIRIEAIHSQNYQVHTDVIVMHRVFRR